MDYWTFMAAANLYILIGFGCFVAMIGVLPPGVWRIVVAMVLGLIWPVVMVFLASRATFFFLLGERL